MGHAPVQHLVFVNRTVQTLNLVLAITVSVELATKYLRKTRIIATMSMNVLYLEHVVRNVKISKAVSNVRVMMATN